MITNERQYRAAKAEAEKFAAALQEPEEPEPDVHPRIRQAIREGAEGLLHELREQVADYERLRAGHVRAIDARSLTELPQALIQARIAAGLTQKELAYRLGLKEQQIQRYEATRYRGATLTRLQQVADALGVTIHERVVLPSAAVDANPGGPTPTVQ